MARSARRYDIFLPLTYNDDSPIEDEKFSAVERTLLRRFDGLTSQQRKFPLRGIWQGETRLYYDQIVLLTVFDFRPKGSTRFFTSLKKELLRDFRQEEILITESSLRVH